MNNNKQINATGTPVTFLQVVDTAFTKSWTLRTAALVAIAMVVSRMYGEYLPTQVPLSLAGKEATVQHLVMWWNTLQCPYWVSGVVGFGIMVVNLIQTLIHEWKNLDKDFESDFVLGSVLCAVIGGIFGFALGSVLSVALGSVLVFAIATISVILSGATFATISVILSGATFGVVFGFVLSAILGFVLSAIFGGVSGLPILDILEFEVVWLSILVLLFGIIFTLIGAYRKFHVK